MWLADLTDRCLFNCSKGTFCDSNTRNCEPCIDICHPSRGTLKECHDQMSCEDYWSMGSPPSQPQSAAAAAASPAVSAAEYLSTATSYSDRHLIITAAVTVGIAVTLLILCFVVFFKRKYIHDRFRNLAKRCSIPVQVSIQEQALQLLDQHQTMTTLTTPLSGTDEDAERGRPRVARDDVSIYDRGCDI